MISAMSIAGEQEFIGIRNLMVEVVLQAVKDLSDKEEKVVLGAKEFVFSQEFDDICSALNISSTALLEKVFSTIRSIEEQNEIHGSTD